MGFFHVKGGIIFMKMTIENLEFPSTVKQKIKTKGSIGNLDIKYISGHLIKFNKTNLSITEPHKIIVTHNNNILIAYLYNDTDKIYLPNNNIIISLTRFITILTQINRQ